MIGQRGHHWGKKTKNCKFHKCDVDFIDISGDRGCLVRYAQTSSCNWSSMEVDDEFKNEGLYGF